MYVLNSAAPCLGAKSNRFWWQFCMAWLAACLAWEISHHFWSFDILLSNWWGSPAGFELRNHIWWGQRLYTLERLLGWAAMLALCAIAFMPRGKFPAIDAIPRAERWGMLLSVIASLVFIQYLKRHSATSCPWDLQLYGGAVPYLSPWQWSGVDGGPGRCFPAGHPSAAFAYLGVVAIMGRHSVRIQRILLATVVLGGLVMGLTQIARGAHFLSHVLWTGVWCCAVASIGMLICQRITRDSR